jgi:hypothetical protein
MLTTVYTDILEKNLYSFLHLAVLIWRKSQE